MYSFTQNPTQEDAVTNLQRYLRQLHLVDPSFPPVPIDGIFESDTQDALRIFQESRNLPVTGIADQSTWELLFEAYRAALVQAHPPAGIDLFPVHPVGFALQPEDRGFAVNALQYALQELGYIYDDEDPIPQSGIYDNRTRDAVLRFQQRNHLPPSGKTDLLTWNYVINQYNTLFRR